MAPDLKPSAYTCKLTTVGNIAIISNNSTFFISFFVVLQNYRAKI